MTPALWAALSASVVLATALALVGFGMSIPPDADVSGEEWYR